MALGSPSGIQLQNLDKLVFVFFKKTHLFFIEKMLFFSQRHRLWVVGKDLLFFHIIDSILQPSDSESKVLGAAPYPK